MNELKLNEKKYTVQKFFSKFVFCYVLENLKSFGVEIIYLRGESYDDGMIMHFC